MVNPMEANGFLENLEILTRENIVSQETEGMMRTVNARIKELLAM